MYFEDLTVLKGENTHFYFIVQVDKYWLEYDLKDTEIFHPGCSDEYAFFVLQPKVIMNSLFQELKWIMQVIFLSTSLYRCPVAGLCKNQI